MNFEVGKSYRFLGEDGWAWLNDHCYTCLYGSEYMVIFEDRNGQENVINRDLTEFCEWELATGPIQYGNVNLPDDAFKTPLEKAVDGDDYSTLTDEELYMYKFKEGDIVEFGGIEGVVDQILYDVDFPVYALFGDECYEFTIDGRYLANHKAPLLKLIKEREMVTVTISKIKAEELGLI